MLVISRRNNEELLIGGNVRVRVLSIRGNRVQLGIEAPEDVRVHRSERFADFDWSFGAADESAALIDSR